MLKLSHGEMYRGMLKLLVHVQFLNQVSIYSFVKVVSRNMSPQMFLKSNRIIRNLTKMKDTTETVCQRTFSEAAQQNFMKLCRYEGCNV